MSVPLYATIVTWTIVLSPRLRFSLAPIDPLASNQSFTFLEVVQTTYRNHGQVYFEHPSVVACGTASGLVIGAGNGTGAAMTAATVARKERVRCLSNIMIFCSCWTFCF